MLSTPRPGCDELSPDVEERLLSHCSFDDGPLLLGCSTPPVSYSAFCAEASSSIVSASIADMSLAPCDGGSRLLIRPRLCMGDFALDERSLRSRVIMSLNQTRAASGRRGGMLTQIIPKLHSMTERLRHGTHWTRAVS